MIIDPSNLDLPKIEFTPTVQHQMLIDRLEKSKFQLISKEYSFDNSCIEGHIRNAFNYVYQAVSEKKRISILDIRNIHTLLGLDGQYRQVSPTGETVWVNKYYTPPDAEHIKTLMDKFVIRFALIDGFTDSLHEICAAYFVFGLIHPFYEANGRTGRLICTWMMFQSGYGFLTPYLEKSWGNENENHAKAFKSQINNYLPWISTPDYLNRFFSGFYLYFLKELVSILDQNLFKSTN